MARPPKQGACSYCDTYAIKAQQFRTTDVDGTHDHYIPLGRGGLDTDDNIVLACRRCNDMKSDYMPLDFVSLAPSRKRALMAMMRQQERMSVRDLAEFGSSRWKDDPRLEILAKRFADARIGFAFTADELEEIAADLAANRGGEDVGKTSGKTIEKVLGVLAKNGGYMTASEIGEACGAPISGALCYYRTAGYIDRRQGNKVGLDGTKLYEYAITDVGRARMDGTTTLAKKRQVRKKTRSEITLCAISAHEPATYSDVTKAVGEGYAKRLGDYAKRGYLQRSRNSDGVYAYSLTDAGRAKIGVASHIAESAVNGKTSPKVGADFTPIGIDTIKQAYGDDGSETTVDVRGSSAAGELNRINQRISDVVRSVADETRNREDLAGRLTKRIALLESKVSTLQSYTDGSIETLLDAVGDPFDAEYANTINGRLEAIEARLSEMRDDAKADIRRKIKSAVGRIGKALIGLSE